MPADACKWLRLRHYKDADTGKPLASHSPLAGARAAALAAHCSGSACQCRPSLAPKLDLQVVQRAWRGAPDQLCASCASSQEASTAWSTSQVRCWVCFSHKPLSSLATQTGVCCRAFSLKLQQQCTPRALPARRSRRQQLGRGSAAGGSSAAQLGRAQDQPVHQLPGGHHQGRRPLHVPRPGEPCFSCVSAGAS